MCIARTVMLLLIVLALTACSSSQIAVNFAAPNAVNGSSAHQQLPLEIKLYQLKDPGRFRQASWRQLWLADQQALGDTLLQKSIVIIKPRSERRITLQRNSMANYLGIIAVYQQPKGQRWRLLQPIPQGLWFIPGSIHIKVTQGALTLQ